MKKTWPVAAVHCARLLLKQGVSCNGNAYHGPTSTRIRKPSHSTSKRRVSGCRCMGCHADRIVLDERAGAIVALHIHAGRGAGGCRRVRLTARNLALLCRRTCADWRIRVGDNAVERTWASCARHRQPEPRPARVHHVRVNGCWRRGLRVRHSTQGCGRTNPRPRSRIRRRRPGKSRGLADNSGNGVGVNRCQEA